ncbi:hypothetical protein [Stenotrophomonas maltophilia]|uniref:hypothetical protein n=1 Tax=Stenotrophomonas maltophilia TaxID=40324 RepID=UPI001FA8012A|nr:hypothetical protein [Stenotrophomonas maltophilia]
MSAPVHVQPHKQRCHCCGESVDRCRETYRGMTASIDVLAVLDLAACRERDAGMPDGVQLAARAAVAELIAADEEYNRAREAWLGSPGNHDEFQATRDAWKRRLEALARVKGGAA